MNENYYICHIFVTRIYTRFTFILNAFAVSKNSFTFVLMFEKLQTKWKINGTQLFLVLCVFAIGGSATGYFGKIIMNGLSIEHGWLWTVIYILVVTIIWPLNVLLVSIPFGQFPFFLQYLRRMGTRMGLLKPHDPLQSIPYSSASPGQTMETTHKSLPPFNHSAPITRIAIFASGTGSNAKKIIDYFRNHSSVQIALIASNKPQAAVLTIANTEKIPIFLIEKEKFFRGNGYLDELKSADIGFIVLAGFLWKIPQSLITAFRNRIVNIHPALLPKYGGKGMYGNLVHEAVINAGEKESGITIHYVDEHYDNGDIVFQTRVGIADNETPQSLAQKIHALEYNNYPLVIERLILEPNGS